MQNSLEKIEKINGYTYSWKDLNADQSLQTGVIAQEVQKLFPELVKEDKEGMLSVNYSGLIPILIESTKELKQQVDQQRQQIEMQQQQINELKNFVAEIVARN